MPDFRELFTSDDFAAYQDRIVDEVVGWLHTRLFYDHGPSERWSAAEIRAGVDMARLILDIPLGIIPTGDVAQRLQARAKARLTEIPAALLRKELTP